MNRLLLNLNLFLALTLPSTAMADDFCSNLADSIGSLERSMGFDPSLSSVHRTNTAQAIMTGMRSGTAQEYLPLQYLVAQTKKQGFIPTSKLLGHALHIQEPTMTLASVDDLKNLPFVQEGTHLLIMTSSATPLDEKRLRVVVFTALRMRVRISVLWVGEGQENDVTLLNALATSTNGQFVDLTNSKNACVSKI